MLVRHAQQLLFLHILEAVWTTGFLDQFVIGKEWHYELSREGNAWGQARDRNPPAKIPVALLYPVALGM